MSGTLGVGLGAAIEVLVLSRSLSVWEAVKVATPHSLVANQGVV